MIYVCTQPPCKQLRLFFLLLPSSFRVEEFLFFVVVLCLIDFINVSISNLYVYVYLHPHSHSPILIQHPHIYSLAYTQIRTHTKNLKLNCYWMLKNPQAQTTWKLTFLSVLLFHSFTFLARREKTVSDI